MRGLGRMADGTRQLRRRCARGAAVWGLALASVALQAQTLARPGWAGSGITVEKWWRHAVMVDVPASEGAGADSEWKGTIDRLDTMRAMGVDALLLRGIGAESTVPAIDGAEAGAGGVDDLFREASRHGVRVLVELRGDGPATELSGAARSWAARGAAGFVVTGGGAEALRTVKAAVRGIPGERVLVSATGNGAGPSGDGAELHLQTLAGLSPRPDPALLRTSLTGLDAAGKQALFAVGEPPPAMEVARVAAAALLLGAPGAALVEESWLGTDAAGSPGAPHSLADQLQQFSALHHERPSVREGTTTVLDHSSEGAVAWLRRSANGAVLVVVENLAPEPVRLSLMDDVARLHLRGTFLKTLSRSDNGLGGMPLGAVAVPGFGVYVGELSR